MQYGSAPSVVLLFILKPDPARTPPGPSMPPSICRVGEILFGSVLWSLDTKEMTDNSPELHDPVSFSLESGDDTSDGDSRSASLTTTPTELKQYIGAEDGDDFELCSHVSNGNDSSCDSLVDTEDPR